MGIESRSKAVADAQAELEKVETREAATPEEAATRSEDLKAAADSLEKAIGELREFKRSESLKAEAKEVSTELSPAGTVKPAAPKVEVRASIVSDARPSKHWDSAEQARRVGQYLVRMSRGELRATSQHPIGSTDTIAADSMGELSPTYDGKGSELVQHELYRGILEQLYYQSICLDFCSVYNINTSGLHIPIAGEAPLAEFYAENTEIKPFSPATSKATLDLHKMGQRVQASNELISDAYISVANLVQNQIASSFSLTCDTTWLQGNSTIGVTGLCDAVEAYDSGSHVGTITDITDPTTGELAFPWQAVHPNARNRKWLVSPEGWAAVMAMAASPEAGAVVTDSVRAQIYGAPVTVTSLLPDDVYAVYGDFGMASSVGVKSNGLKVVGSAERAMELDAYVWVGTNRMAWNTHSPEFLAMLKKA